MTYLLGHKRSLAEHVVQHREMTLKEIENKVNQLGGIIKAASNLFPTYGFSKDFAYPHIEVDNIGMHYVIIERGQELERKTTNNIDELLYWIFDNVTFSMSTDFELKNRDESKDCRRIMFSKQEELLDLINPEWKEIAKKEHKEILGRNPFDDLAGLRATYCGELRANGLSEPEINKLANEKYPEN